MIATVNTNLKASISDRGVEFIVLLGNPTVGLGELVNYKRNNKLVGQRFVSYKHTTKMSKIDQESLELLHPSLHIKEALWMQLEDSHGSPIPGHYDVTIIGVCTSEYYTKEPINTQERSYSLDEYFDLAEEYEDEFGDYDTVERIKRRDHNDD